jgi:peptide deformylase
MIRPILLLGNPLLLQRCEPVTQAELPEARQVIQDLHDTMMDFRTRHGWGRAIAAPQIGVLKRIVYLHIDHPQVFINPVFSEPSVELIELWDDCMSFPDLLVRLRRHRSLHISFRDENWLERSLSLEGALSELLQHEVDHLDGILAVARAIDGTAFAYQSQRQFLGAAGFANPATS